MTDSVNISTVFHHFPSISFIFTSIVGHVVVAFFLIVVAFNVPTNDMFVLVMAVCEISQLASISPGRIV